MDSVDHAGGGVMHDLFAPPQLAREDFFSRKLCLVPVVGDHMAPALRGGWDFVLAAPIDCFKYDALYVVEDDFGQALIYRCSSAINRQIFMGCDNPIYGATAGDRGRYVDYEKWRSMLLGIVVCDLKVRDPNIMRQAWEAGQ